MIIFNIVILANIITLSNLLSPLLLLPPMSGVVVIIKVDIWMSMVTKDKSEPTGTSTFVLTRQKSRKVRLG